MTGIPDADETVLIEGMKSHKLNDRAARWNKKSDEIEELKKIFFEFLKNATERQTGYVYGKPIVYERSPDEEFHTIANITNHLIEEEMVDDPVPEQLPPVEEVTESAAIGESTFVHDMQNAVEERPLVHKNTLDRYN